MSADTHRRSDKEARILIIDDEDIIHRSLRKILEGQDYEVEAVFSAKEGLQRLEEGGIDLIITDLMMPEMDGIELMTALDLRSDKTPILMITGYPTIRTAVQALRLGAMDYLPKPFTPQELLSPVRRAFRQEQEDRPVEKVGEETQETSALLPGDTFYLPHHAWTRFEQDGTFLIGIEKDFLHAVGRIVCIETPQENEMLEQGYPAIHLENDKQERHSVSLPLSGEVIEKNQELLSTLHLIDGSTWILRILPSQSGEELKLLRPRPRQ